MAGQSRSCVSLRLLVGNASVQFITCGETCGVDLRNDVRYIDGFKRARSVRVVKSAAGKVLKHELRAAYGEVS